MIPAFGTWRTASERKARSFLWCAILHTSSSKRHATALGWSFGVLVVRASVVMACGLHQRRARALLSAAMGSRGFGYSSKTRMVVVGPSVMFDVPGFLNVSLLAIDESNSPTGYAGGRYTYKTHAMLTAAWGIPIGSYPMAFEGFMNIIAPKGTNEFGGSTATETNFDGQIMFDVGAIAGGPKGTFKLGVGYQYWKNKFGNPTTGAIGVGSAGPGATAKTPMIRAEYHF